MSKTYTCDNCGKDSFSTNSSQLPSSWKTKSFSTFSINFFCGDRCLREFSNAKNGDNEAKVIQQQVSQHDKELAKIAKMEAQALKKEVESRELLARAEADKIQREIELKEKESRNRRADELRVQGKNFQAFYEQYSVGKVLLFILGFLALGLAFYFITSTGEKKRNDAEFKHNELEVLETKIIQAINSNNTEEALNYVEQLNHDSSLGFGWGSYKSYWQKKKNELKQEILNNDKSKNLESNNAINIQENTIQEKEDFIVETPTINTEEETFNETSKILSEYGTIKNEKAFFYEEPNNSTKKKSYLIKDQSVEILKEDGDFFNILYTNDKGNIVRGWMLKQDISY